MGRKRSSLARSRPRKKPTTSRPETHVHDLTDDCLSRILSLVGDGPLPIERPKHHDLYVHHALQCALVCKRWRSCARAAVRSLTLNSQSLEADLASQATDFSALRRLIIANVGSTPSGALPKISLATPGLIRLQLDLTCREGPDVLSALLAWPRLRNLNLSGLKVTQEVHAAVLQALPTLTAVRRLHLSYDPPEQYGSTWEGIQVRMPLLRHLALHGSVVPPSSVGTIRFLHYSFGIRACHYMLPVALPPSVFTFRNIIHLHLAHVEGASLPPEIGCLARMKTLMIEWSDELESLPCSIGRLRSLQELKIVHCQRLAKLPQQIGKLQELKVVHLWRCDRLTKLPRSFRQLTGVEQLHLEGRTVLPGLQLELPGLRSLKELVVSSCHGLHTIPVHLGTLSLLTHLKLEICVSLVVLPSCIGDLQSLRELRLIRLQELEKLPDSLGRLSLLEVLEIEKCHVYELPKTLGGLSSLVSLRVKGCDRFIDLSQSLCDVRSLRELRVEDCEDFANLPIGLERLVNLTELVIRNCETFFDLSIWGIVNARSLRFLWLAGCQVQYCLPDDLTALKELRAIKCSPGMIERSVRVNGYPASFVEIMEADLEAIDIEEDAYRDIEEDGEDGWVEDVYDDYRHVGGCFGFFPEGLGD